MQHSVNSITPADLVIVSEAVFTACQDRPIRGGVAVVGNRISAVGPMADVRKHIGPRTRIHRFENQLVLPGFHDHHVHVFCGSLAQESVWLEKADSEAAAARMTAAFAAGRPDDPWLHGFCWYHAFWDDKTLPQRHSLDRLVADRPVFLFNAELHGAWVNTRALETCGITRDTPDPDFGRIERDHRGEPTGFLYETAMGLAAPQAFDLSRQRRTGLLRGFLAKTARLGITSVGDMQPLPGMELGDTDIYREFEERGELTTRIHLVTALGADLASARRLRAAYTSPRLRFSALKQFLDGVHTTYTAYTVAPYADDPTTRGITLIPPDLVERWVVAADREGFRMRLHACGDGAVRLGLDCFDAAGRINGRRDARHTLEHIESLHPDDAARFGPLGVTASVQPEHLAITATFADNPYRVRLGEARCRMTWPNQTLRRNGARLALGSDYPVVKLDPMLEIYRAVTRLHDDGEPAGGWNPQERLTLAETLRAYTADSAYAAFRESDLGILAPGKSADIVVLDRNLFDIEAEEILDAKVKLTLMDGQVVYED